MKKMLAMLLAAGAMLGANGGLVGTPKNPFWIGEKTTDTLQFGEWTMDIDVALEKVRTFNDRNDDDRAYVLVLVEGYLWCPDCVMADRWFFSYETNGVIPFKEWARSRNVALGVVDIPNYNAVEARSYGSLLMEDTFKTADSYVTGRGTWAADETMRYQSGAEYLASHGISADAAAAIIERNRSLAQGFFRRPESSNPYRVGVPTLILLRDNGTIAGRFDTFAQGSPSAYSANFLVRLDELLKQVDEAAEESNDDWRTASETINVGDDTGMVNRTLSHTDLKDVYMINNAIAGQLVTFRLSSSLLREVTLSMCSVSNDSVPIDTVTGPANGGLLVTGRVPDTACYLAVSVPRSPADQNGSSELTYSVVGGRVDESAEKCTVSFDLNGSGGLSAEEQTRVVLKDSPVGELPTPVVPNMADSGFGRFLGWFTAKTGGTQISADTIVTNDVTYYVHWTKISFPVVATWKYYEEADDEEGLNLAAWEDRNAADVPFWIGAGVNMAIPVEGNISASDVALVAGTYSGYGTPQIVSDEWMFAKHYTALKTAIGYDPYEDDEYDQGAYGPVFEDDVRGRNYSLSMDIWPQKRVVSGRKWILLEMGGRPTRGCKTFYVGLKGRDDVGYSRFRIYATPDQGVSQSPSDWSGQRELAVLPMPIGGGTTSGSGMYASGTRVSLSATPSAGYEFEGWYDRESGQLLGTSTSLSHVTTDADEVIFAKFRVGSASIVAGSCAGAAIPFAFGPSVATYPVSLTKAWLADEGRYDDASGVLYCRSTVSRGKVYTIALPAGQAFEVTCTDAGAVVEYATSGALRYCCIDARNLSAAAEIVLAAYGAAGARTTVYVVEGDLVPVNAAYEDPAVGGLPGSCPGKATVFAFGPSVAAKTVRLVREWDEIWGRYLGGGVQYLMATVPTSGRLTVAVPVAQAAGCEVSCAGAATSREDFGGLAFWIFDAKAGNEVLVRLSGARGADATMYAYGGDYLAKRLLFDPNGGSCPVASKEVRAGVPVGELPTPAFPLHAFQGWFTAREGGARVTAATAMVSYNVALYAHWEAVAAGSCLEKSIPFPFGPSVAAYPVNLAKEWLADEGRYDASSGVLYCKSSVARGKVYTIALPVGQSFEVVCADAGAVVEYASWGALRYCRVDARGLVSGTAEIVLMLYGRTGARTTVYVVEGDLVPADADYEAPPVGSCPGKATAFTFGTAVQARAVRLVREWDESGGRYLEGGVHYLRTTAPADGQLTVAVPTALAEGCEVSCAGSATVGPEAFGGLAFWIFDAQVGDEVLVRLSGARGVDATMYAYGGDYLAKRLLFDPNGGSCPVASKEVRAGAPVGELPEPAFPLNAFQGWFTARSGGTRVTAATTMVGYDVTLYAHWEAVAAGSCLEKAIAFPFGPSVAAYPVNLAKEWLADEGRYDASSGVLYCKSSVARGKVYTIALPVGQKFDVACAAAEAIIEYATYGALRYCVINAHDLPVETAEIVLALYGGAGARTTVYVVEGDLVPADADYEAPPAGSCPGKATAFTFGSSVVARTVRLVREWDEIGGRYLDGAVHYLRATASVDGRLTVAVPAAQAEGCEVSCAGSVAANPESFGGLAFWIFDAQAGDEVLVVLSGVRGSETMVYTYGGDYLPKRLLFDPNGGTCPVVSKSVRAGVPVGELPMPDDRAGYAFQGWFTAREGGARVMAATVMVDYDVTLYAHWEPRRYKVTFMSQGRVITTRTVTFMSPLGSLPVPSAPWDNTYQTYWHFHGWYYGDQFMVSSDTIMSVPSDITLTASWLAPMGI